MSDSSDITSILGPLAALLDEEDITEISANADGGVFVKRFGKPPHYWGRLAREDADRFLRWLDNLRPQVRRPALENLVFSYGARLDFKMLRYFDGQSL